MGPPEGVAGGSGGSSPRASTAQLGRRHREDLVDGRVELPDAGEAGREGDLGQRQRGRLDQDARRLRPLRAGDGERARAQFGRDQAAHLALLVAEPAGQALHAVPVDHAVGDQPHRAAHHVGPDVPLGRAGGGVRAAPLAGPEARLLGRRRAAVEPHVLAFRRDRRAGRAAVNAGRGHRYEEHAVEAGILADRRLVAPLVIQRRHAGDGLGHISHNASSRGP